MQRARVLLLPINDTPNNAGILPGKLYEYLSVGRPVLAVGPTDGDVARVLQAGHVLIARTPSANDRQRVRDLFSRTASDADQQIAAYDRRNLAGAMAILLNGVTGSA
jgi:hypothetical protein